MPTHALTPQIRFKYGKTWRVRPTTDAQVVELMPASVHTDGETPLERWWIRWAAAPSAVAVWDAICARRTAPEPASPVAPPAPQRPAPITPRVPRFRPCGICGGSGRTSCFSCGGVGSRPRSASRRRSDGTTEYYTEQVSCSGCTGGRTMCLRCSGHGQVPA